MITKDNIWDETERCNLEVLKSDLVNKVKDSDSWTPLHYLAWCGVKKVFSHSSVDKVKDNRGQTPLHILAYKNCLTKKDLREKYPWYKKEIKNLWIAIDEITNTPTSIRFILED